MKRERHAGISEQIDVGPFFSFFFSYQVLNVFWTDFPAFKASEGPFVPSHSFQSFHLESKGSPMHVLLLLHVQDRIKESSSCRPSSSLFYNCNMFMYHGGSFNPS